MVDTKIIARAIEWTEAVMHTESVFEPEKKKPSAIQSSLMNNSKISIARRK